jgi:hypothetical protein
MDKYAAVCYTIRIGRGKEYNMKKYGLQFLTMAVLIAMFSGACVKPLDGFEDPVEYDAQGRRLVTVNIDPESAARAVNANVARAYIDFYEVVFVGPYPATEYYSATATKGAGNRLSLRVPVGDYVGYLNAGYWVDDNEAVLLAQATPVSHAANVSWTFSLAALNLSVMGAAALSDPDDPIFVKISGSAATTQKTSSGVPYYIADGNAVEVIVKTGANAAFSTSVGVAEVIPLINTNDKPPVTIGSITPTFSGGNLAFDFIAASTMKGLLNIGFDISMVAVNATRSNGREPVLWHIRNGLDTRDYDNGQTDNTNTGAGILFAFGGVVPEATATYKISFVPPSVP